MKLSFRSSSFVLGLLSFATLFGLGAPPAQGQNVVYPAPSYARPYGYVSPRGYAGVLPGFAPRGGIGTTPFLGNTRGLGAYSHNFDKDYHRSSYTNRSYNNRWYRRGR